MTMNQAHWIPTFATIGLSVSQWSSLATLGAAVLAGSFTVWQWRRAKKKADREDSK